MDFKELRSPGLPLQHLNKLVPPPTHTHTHARTHPRTHYSDQYTIVEFCNYNNQIEKVFKEKT